VKQYILTLDIGGTTFSSSIFDEQLKNISSSDINLISAFPDKTTLLEGFAQQAGLLLKSSNIGKTQLMGMGISAPGPLNAEEGKILETPNLTMLQHTHLAKEMENRIGIPVHIENDANLFAWGVWQKNHPQTRVMTALTLGSGLGVGLIINGKLFTGTHGLGAEYGISPIVNGIWEDEISIGGITTKCSEILGKVHSPEALYKMAVAGNKKALEIWAWFGEKLGYCLSHIVNMLDPEMVVVGGGISRAFSVFIDPARKVLYQFAPSFELHNIPIIECSDYLESIHRGAALLIKEKNA